MKWEKPSQRILDLFDHYVPQEEFIERRKMFGLPCAFINNNMFIGIYKQTLFLRLSNEDRSMMLTLPQATPFEPRPGRIMKEYIVISPKSLYNENWMTDLITKSITYVQSLPPKEKKKRT
jgi:TfoX/Sxy family transcriptional regulator of competence genes